MWYYGHDMIDLHVHSTKSDGSLSPTELVGAALKVPLTAMALTDHDTVSGIDEALSAAQGTGLEVIPGVELSADYNGKEIHVVGLYVNHSNPKLNEYLDHFLETRDIRNIRMCEALSADGYNINIEELKEAFPGCVLTRAHVARLLMKKRYVHSVKEAFDRFLGDHCKYFIPREKITGADAIALIKTAGGIPVLAHPILYHMGSERLELMISELSAAGLEAIEAKYCTYTSSDERQIKELARKYNLQISGGSDYHGVVKPGLKLGIGYGKLYIDDSILKNMLSNLRRI